jgi:hypothetical protein
MGQVDQVHVLLEYFGSKTGNLILILIKQFKSFKLKPINYNFDTRRVFH